MYEVRRWSESELLNGREVWADLLRQSSADPLFNSWEWLTLWWRSYGRTLAQELCVLGIYKEGVLVALAPLYICAQRRRSISIPRSIQVLGNHWQDSDTLISEYLGLIAKVDHQEPAHRACVEYLFAAVPFSELIIACTPDTQIWNEAIAGVSRHRGYLRQPADSLISYQADLSQGFAAYLSGLGPSTRRSLVGLRRRLESHGAVQISTTAIEGSRETIGELNRLHEMRWGAPAFAGSRLAFHTELCSRLGAPAVRLSELKVAGKLVSVLYDLRVGEVQYNIQSGFDPTFDRRLSLGLLHLGYALEMAAAEGAVRYDFLAGSGRATNFKTHLAQHSRPLASVQYVRSTLLSVLYRWHDRFVRQVNQKMTDRS